MKLLIMGFLLMICLTISAEAASFPILKGYPPKEFSYKDLGSVQASFRGDSFLESDEDIFNKYLANDLIKRAKAKGANAIVNVMYLKTQTGLYSITGEAVLILSPNKK